MRTVIGLFDSANEAQAARNDLLGSGIETDRISIVTRPAGDMLFPQDSTEAAQGAGIGATAGAIAGGAAGLLASLGQFLIPGIGPILAAGSIVAILTGAGIGAATGGIIGSLIGLGIPHHEAEAYAEGLDRGGTLLTVDATDNDADRIAWVLSQNHAVDIEKRAMEWEAEGWERKYPSPGSELPDDEDSIPNVNARERGVERENDRQERPEATKPRSRQDRAPK